MQKFTFSGNTSSGFRTASSFSSKAKVAPSEHTLRRILAFAAIYRTQQISENQYINYHLN